MSMMPGKNKLECLHLEMFFNEVKYFLERLNSYWSTSLLG